MPRRDWYLFGAIWFVVSIVLMGISIAFSMLPAGYAAEAEIVDEAYVLLMVLGAPVLALVVAMIIMALWRFRAADDSTEDGPPIQGTNRFVAGWIVVTSALALFVLINPGFVGLAAIRGEAASDMVIEVEARRFAWEITYPDGTVTGEELVLPNDTRIRFDVTSKDVLHSFWVPAFRTKIDAVPGRTTRIYVSTEEVGSFEEDYNLRIQCAELCGAGHSRMDMPVRIVEADEFSAALSELATEE